MWVAFLRAYQFLEKILPPRIIYDPKLKRFVENHKPSKIYKFVNANVVQIHIVAVLRMIYYLRTDQSISGFAFIDFVLDLLLWALTTMQMCCVFSFYKRGYCLAYFLNQYMMAKNLKNDKFDFQTIMLYSLVGICLVFPLTLTALPIIFHNTTIHQILWFYLPTVIMSNKVIEILLCALYLCVCTFYGVIPILTCLLSALMLVIEAGQSLKPTYINRVSIRKMNKRLPKKPAEQHLIITLTFQRSIKIYKRSFLIWEAGMRFGYLFYPILMFSAYFINVVTTFACVKLYNQLPPIMLMTLAVIDVAVLANTGTFHYFALVICSDFEKFFEFWNRELKSRKNRRILRACMPIRVKIGSLFCLKSSTLLVTFQQIVDMTVTLLLAA